MIDPDKRNAIYQLHLAGRALREISRQLQVSRNAVRAVIRQQGAGPKTVRKDKIQIDPDLLQRLYQERGGWIQRIHEKLVEEHKIQIGYPTLTRLLRELGLGQPRQERCARVPDEPGAEMQHDTTVYQVPLAGKPTRLIASLLYLRYSKRRYLKFYRVFNRFAMKCFFHEALMFWGCAALRDRQYQPGASAGQRRPSGDRTRNGLVRRPLRLSLPLPRDPSSQSQGRGRTQFLDGRDQLPARPQLREPGRSESAGVRVGHGPHAPSSGKQDGLDSRQGLRARTELSGSPAARTSRPLLFAPARHRSIRLCGLPGQLLLGAGRQA